MRALFSKQAQFRDPTAASGGEKPQQQQDTQGIRNTIVHWADNPFANGGDPHTDTFTMTSEWKERLEKAEDAVKQASEDVKRTNTDLAKATSDITALKEAFLEATLKKSSRPLLQSKKGHVLERDVLERDVLEREFLNI